MNEHMSLATTGPKEGSYNIQMLKYFIAGNQHNRFKFKIHLRDHRTLWKFGKKKKKNEPYTIQTQKQILTKPTN